MSSLVTLTRRPRWTRTSIPTRRARRPRRRARYQRRPAGAGKLGLDDPLCASQSSLCADSVGTLNGYYVGHDEPSLLFKSNKPGSGNNMTYLMTLPKDPTSTLPTAFGGPDSATWNFQLRPTFWFGMTMCDTESAPEYTKKCKPDSDRNDLQ